MIEARIAWECEAAPVLDQLRIRKRDPVAKEREILDRRPPGDDTVDDVVRALGELGTCRQVGFGLGPIPITAVWEYWRLKGYDEVAVDLLTGAVLRGDRVYREKMSVTS